MRKLRLREVKYLAQRHTASKWQSQEFKPRQSVSGDHTHDSG